jgi:hypothetical protein
LEASTSIMHQNDLIFLERHTGLSAIRVFGFSSSLSRSPTRKLSSHTPPVNDDIGSSWLGNTYLSFSIRTHDLARREIDVNTMG